MARIAPYVFFQEFDNNGAALAGGKVWTYEAGTNTPKVTYSDASEGTANANPVLLDSAGRASIWLGDGAYKFVLTDAADNIIKTVDNVTGDSPNAFGAQVNTIATNTTITDVYANSTNICTASVTLSLLPVATAGMGFYFSVRANYGNVTIDPNSSETIDGLTTLVIPSGATALIISNGTAWFSLFMDDVTRARGSAGVVLQNSAGATVATFGPAGTTNASVVGGLTVGGIATFSNAAETAKGADIASAATTDLGAATGNFVHITGTTTITSFGTENAGAVRFVRFASSLLLTHNATSLILPGGQSITTSANDTAVFVSEGSGNWRCIAYQSYSDSVTPWVAYTPTFTAFGTVTNISFFSRRNGPDLEVIGRFTPGVLAASEARITLGFNGTNNNVTVNATVVPSIRPCGSFVQNGNNAAIVYPLIEPSVGYMTFGAQSSTTASLTKQNGNGTGLNSATDCAIKISVPISGW